LTWSTTSFEIISGLKQNTKHIIVIKAKGCSNIQKTKEVMMTTDAFEAGKITYGHDVKNHSLKTGIYHFYIATAKNKKYLVSVTHESFSSLQLYVTYII